MMQPPIFSANELMTKAEINVSLMSMMKKMNPGTKNYLTQKNVDQLRELNREFVHDLTLAKKSFYHIAKFEIDHMIFSMAQVLIMNLIIF